ncbi:hypothetical protein C1Y40_01701 [Mycobacterium talmoniae]|uniref:Uncharacterized protein n=1 Tax=Mycobacterium talmoniae TaxID=1858794 RepID=A0A2S8BNC8_9MYCO|nr:hypothetical protein C1Y40_01701 [Mycobacterium talmoniae]
MQRLPRNDVSVLSDIPGVEVVSMGRIVRGVVAALVSVAAIGVGVAVAPVAQAAPRCLFEGDWNCEGTPPYNGPGLNTWDVPGTYGGWTTNPLQCDPITGQCRQVVTP